MSPANNKGLTIRDIARLTGFSRSTVSLAMGDGAKIKESTRLLILATIHRVGYVPDAAARELGARSRKSSTTGPSLYHSESEPT